MKKIKSFFKYGALFIFLTASVSAVCMELFSSFNDEQVNKLILTKPLEAGRDPAHKSQ